MEVIVMSKNIKKSNVERLYDQLGISQKSNELKEYPFFNSDEDKHLAWKPLIV